MGGRTKSPCLVFVLARKRDSHFLIHHLQRFRAVIMILVGSDLCYAFQDDARPATWADLNVSDDLVECVLDVLDYLCLSFAGIRVGRFIAIQDMKTHGSRRDVVEWSQ